MCCGDGGGGGGADEDGDGGGGGDVMRVVAWAVVAPLMGKSRVDRMAYGARHRRRQRYLTWSGEWCPWG